MAVAPTLTLFTPKILAKKPGAVRLTFTVTVSFDVIFVVAGFLLFAYVVRD